MTAELWLVKPCQEGCNLARANFCDHDKWVRLDPEQVVWRHRDGWYLTARDILDGLDEEEE